MNHTKPGQKTVIYSWLHVIATTLKSYHIDPVSFLAAWDLQYDPSTPQDARVPTIKVFRALSHAQKECGDEAFGIKLAKNILPTMFHGLATAAIASENQISALRLLSNHFHVICESVLPTLFKREDQLIVCLNSTDAIIPPSAIYEAFFAALIHGGQEYMGVKSTPISVHFTRSKPQDPNVFSDFFNCKIVYGEPANYMVLPAKGLNNPAMSHNPAAQAVMLELVKSYQHDREERSYSEMVGFCIKSNIFNGQTSLKVISDSLNMSSRSLQDHLNKEGNSFREISEQVQLEVSNSLMLSSDIPLEQLALKLGYNSSSNFCRAYKRWAGMTPNQYRNAPYGVLE